MQDRDLFPFGEGQVAARCWSQRDRRHPASLTEPPRPNRLGHAGLRRHSYPLFYDTLFADLRGALTTAADNARSERKRLWSRDLSQNGITVTSQDDLEQAGVIFPKLFRRLTEFLTEPGNGLSGFVDWLADKKEQAVDLTANANFTHFDNLVDVTANTVRLSRRPEQIVFVSAKSASPVVAPWLEV